MALNAVIGLGNNAPQRRIPFSSVMYSMLSDSAERIMLSSGGKGQLKIVCHSVPQQSQHHDQKQKLPHLLPGQ
jgi:hypothetical protein